MSVAWLVHELQACQLFMTNTFLNAQELLMKMFCDSLLKVSKLFPPPL